MASRAISTGTPVAESVLSSRAMMKAGHGDDTASFTDRVLGTNFTVNATPRAFLSFLGPGSMLSPGRVLRRPACPGLLGRRHQGFQPARRRRPVQARAGRSAQPLRPVNAGHMGTPGAALVPMLDWLDRLSGD